MNPQDTELLNSLCEKMYKKGYDAGVEAENKRIELDIRSSWKHGDLREGNFKECMDEIFNPPTL